MHYRHSTNQQNVSEQLVNAVEQLTSNVSLREG